MAGSKHLRRIVGALVALLVAPVMGGPWTDPDGSADNFTYANGGDLNGLFGDPFVFGDAFFFSTTFSVNTSNGATDSQSDTVAFDAFANPGLFFSGVTVVGSGSYAITGDDSSVNLDAEISMEEIGGLQRQFTDDLTTLPPFPITSGSGTWDGEATIDVESVFPVPDDAIHFELSNNVLAISGPAGNATLNVFFEQLTIQLDVIPEPATLSLLTAGGLVVLCRRRRPA